LKRIIHSDMERLAFSDPSAFPMFEKKLGELGRWLKDSGNADNRNVCDYIVKQKQHAELWTETGILASSKIFADKQVSQGASLSDEIQKEIEGLSAGMKRYTAELKNQEKKTLLDVCEIEKLREDWRQTMHQTLQYESDLFALDRR